MSNISESKNYFFLVVALLGSNFVFSASANAERCEPQPGNEYEKIFCDLKRTGRGASLPNIYQFRDNTPLTQALLLKKPAERAGITIKIPERDNVETLRRQEELLLAAPANEGPVPLKRAVTTIKIIQQAPAVTPAVMQPRVETPVASAGLPTVIEKTEPDVSVKMVTSKTVDAKVAADNVVANPVASEPAAAIAAAAVTAPSTSSCTLQQLILQCADNRYQLVGNKTNQQLADKALSDEHKLALPIYSGAEDDNKALEEYLAKAYERYLQGMIEIGLGASTMSYTKFVNLHRYIVGQKLDFVARFETMYSFLKKDKAAIGVSTKLAVAEGFIPENCSELDNFVACDYQKSNYVFAKLDHQ